MVTEEHSQCQQKTAKIASKMGLIKYVFSNVFNYADKRLIKKFPTKGPKRKNA